MPPQKILIINIFGVGDVLFTTPLITNLKNYWPQVSIGYLCNQRTGEIFKNHPQVDKVFIYERDEYHAIYRQSKIKFINKMRQTLKNIRQEKFDLAIDLSLNPSIGFFLWLVGIKERIGFDYRRRGRFLTRKMKMDGYEDQAVTEYYLDILKELNVPITERALKIFPGPDDRQYAGLLLSRYGCPSTERPVAIFPGGGASWGQAASFKRWDVENYAQLADKIIEKFNVKVILMGDQKESGLCQDLAGRMHRRPIIISGQTTLNQLAAVLENCRLAVLNDGGPLHVAVACGTRTVSIFGPVDERVYGPYEGFEHSQIHHDHTRIKKHLVVTKTIACRPCYRRFRMVDCAHHNCLKTLSVDEVFRKVEEAL